MNKVLVLYATHYGQTRAIAAAIAQRLRERGCQVDLLDLADRAHLPAPHGYDALVLGSRVEVGKHAGDLRSYVQVHRDALDQLPTAFFSVSMAAASPAAGPDPSGYMASSFDDLGWHPRLAASFAGGLPYRKYGWFMRFVMKRISRAAGRTTDTSRDHEFTDWTRVAAFADDLVALLPATTSPPTLHAV